MHSSKLSLGTAQFGSRYGISSRQKVPKVDVGPILELAKQLGIATIETAPSYGDAERVLGQHDLSSFNVITKTIPKQLSADTVLLSFLASLERLGLKKVYGLLIHNAKDQNIGAQVGLLRSLQQRGFVDKIGVCVYSGLELRAMLRRFTPDIVSIPLNVFDQRFAAEEQDVIETLVATGCEIHARSVFLQGVVFMDPSALPAHLASLKERLSSLTPHLALEFIKRQHFVDYCTVGVEGLEQFLQVCNLWANDIPASINFDVFKEDDIRITNPSLWPVG